MQFQQVAGLAAGRGAGIQHPHAWPGTEQPRGQLRRRILHRHVPLGEAGQAHDVHRPRQPQRFRGEVAGLGLEAGLPQAPHIGRRAGAPDIDAQPHRRLAVAGGEHGLAVVGPVPAEGVDQPGRVSEACLRLAVGAIEDLLSLALEAPQTPR